MKTFTASKIIVRIHEHGGELTLDGKLLRYKGPALTEELRTLIREHKPDLLVQLATDAGDDGPVTCRGCAVAIPGGTTLCPSCGSKRSPLIRYALELSALTEGRTLRGRALGALDRRRYPRLVLASGQAVGPGLLEWAPVLREMNLGALRDLERVLARSAGPDVEVSDP